MCFEYAIVYTTYMGRFVVDEEHCPQYSESGTCPNNECFESWVDEVCPVHMAMLEFSISDEDLDLPYLSKEHIDLPNPPDFPDLWDSSYFSDPSDYLHEDSGSPIELLRADFQADLSVGLSNSPNESSDEK